jgi:hypothetical protein
MNKSLLNGLAKVTIMQMCGDNMMILRDWQNANMGRETNFSTTIFMGIIAYT